MITLFKSTSFLLSLICVLFVCILAYGQITRMYFYLEDYLTLYTIQNSDAPQVKFGSGLFFGHPDGYEITPFIPFYHIFGLDAGGYYFVEMGLYFLTALAVYFLAKTLSYNKNVALGASLIFASGYVGSESLYRMAVGWQNVLAAFFITVTTTLYLRFVKSSDKRIYLLAFAFYLFTCDFSFYRAHGIILLILATEIFFNFKIWHSIMRMTPFVLGYWYFYVYSISDIMDQSSKSAVFIQKIFVDKNFHYLLTPLKTLENLFVPDRFHFPMLIFIVSLLSILIWKRSKILVYCLIFTAANYLVYFYVSPEAPQETTHRYLTVPFVGVALFWGIFLNKVFKSTGKYLFFCIALVILNLLLVRSEQTSIIQNRSQPTSEFWQSFHRQVVNLKKGSVIYIDTRQDGVSKPARDAALSAGSMSATTSFAVNYGLKWEDITLVESFPELIDLLKTSKVDRDNIYTFFYSREGGLINTSDQTKTVLFDPESDTKVADLENINLPFYSPKLLKFDIEIKTDFSNVKYNKDTLDLPRYLAFLASRSLYFSNVSASAATETKYAEAKNIADWSIQSSWKGDNLTWSRKHQEEVILSLGESRQIGAVRLVPANLERTPIKYSYDCSIDGIHWNQLASSERKINKLDPFTDKFKEANCAFVRLIIYKTVSDRSPQISEIEVLESQFVDMDITLSEAVEKDPSSFIKSDEDRRILVDYFLNNGISGKICVHTNKYKPMEPACKKYIFYLGLDTGRSFLIDQGGTILERIEFLLPPGFKISTQNASVESVGFAKL